ncbi:MAG: YhjD/YihY/BrkB family envelope integrity protein [Balneolaceae bacterium]
MKNGSSFFRFNRSKFKEFWRQVWRLILEKDLFFNASAITFNLFICAIPFTLILISILGYILSMDAAFDEVLRYGRELFPTLSFESEEGDVIEGAITLERLIMPLVSGRRTFGIIGLIVLFFFAQGLFHTLKQVLFNVFDIEDRRHPAMEMVYNFFAFGLVGSLFVFFTMAVSLTTFFTFGQYSIPYTDIVIELNWIPDLLTTAVPVIFTFFLFFLIFRYISEKRMGIKISLLAASIYTLLFEGARMGISLYLEYALSAYQYLYQGYTVLTIIAIWAFYSAILFVVSSIIARAYQDIYITKQPLALEESYTATT